MLSCGGISANSQLSANLLFPSRTKSLQQLADSRSDLLQLLAVDGSELLQDFLTAKGKLNQDPAAILGGRQSTNPTALW